MPEMLQAGNAPPPRQPKVEPLGEQPGPQDTEQRPPAIVDPCREVAHFRFPFAAACTICRTWPSTTRKFGSNGNRATAALAPVKTRAGGSRPVIVWRIIISADRLAQPYQIATANSVPCTKGNQEAGDGHVEREAEHALDEARHQDRIYHLPVSLPISVNVKKIAQAA